MVDYISILKDLNEILINCRDPKSTEYKKACKMKFAISDYNNISDALYRMMHYFKIEYVPSPKKLIPANQLVNHLKKGKLSITQYGRNIIDLNTITQNIYGILWRLELKNESDKSSIKEAQQVITNYIVANNNSVAMGYNVNQLVIMQNIKTGDKSSLEVQVKSIGIDDMEWKSLSKALEEDGDRTKDQGFGGKVTSWLSKMSQKIASGTLKLVKETTPLVLSNAISKYYGWM